MGEIKKRTMDIPTETPEPCLKVPPHVGKVIIVAFVHKFIYLFIYLSIYLFIHFGFNFLKLQKVGTQQLASYVTVELHEVLV